MKILHTADWHLGKRLENFSRFEEQKEVLQEIIAIADQEQVDAVLVAGDIYDNFNPTTEAIELFYKTIKILSNGGKRPVIVIAGNHDSPDRIESSDPLAKSCGIILSGYPNTNVGEFALEQGFQITKSENCFIEIQLPQFKFPLRLLLTPYANEFRLKTYLGDETEGELREVLGKSWKSLADEYCDEKGVNVLMAHLFFMQRDGEASEESDDEKSILHIGGAQAIYSDLIPTQIQYVALGHLHRRQTIDKIPCPIVYSGSPIAYSFSETNQQKQVVIIDAEPNKPVEYKNVALSAGKKLLRNKFSNIDDAVVWLQENSDSLVEITIQTENYLTSEDRKRLYDAHDGIINIVPAITGENGASEQATKSLDLDKNVSELFEDYFLHKHGQAPNEEILTLIKEVIAGGNE